jgi:hypothetical protein
MMNAAAKWIRKTTCPVMVFRVAESVKQLCDTIARDRFLRQPSMPPVKFLQFSKSQKRRRRLGPSHGTLLSCNCYFSENDHCADRADFADRPVCL